MFNIQSSFTVQNPRAQLVKIEHMIFLYLSSANSNSALLTITHKNRALLTMASADRFAEIVEGQIKYELMNDFVNDFKPHLYLINLWLFVISIFLNYASIILCYLDTTEFLVYLLKILVQST